MSASAQESITIHIKQMAGNIITLQCAPGITVQEVVQLVHRHFQDHEQAIQLGQIRIFSYDEDAEDAEDEPLLGNPNIRFQHEMTYGLLVLDPAPIEQVLLVHHDYADIAMDGVASIIGRHWKPIIMEDYQRGLYGVRQGIPRIPRATDHPDYMPPRFLVLLPHIRAIREYGAHRLLPHYWIYRIINLHQMWLNWIQTLPPHTPLVTLQQRAHVFVELHIDSFDWGCSGYAHHNRPHIGRRH